MSCRSSVGISFPTSYRFYVTVTDGVNTNFIHNNFPTDGRIKVYSIINLIASQGINSTNIVINNI